jgi:putative membrane protein
LPITAPLGWVDVSISESDPRVYFAAERTLLAWLRTGLTVMAFGFVIARFGLLLQIASLQAPAVVQHAQAGVSTLIGIALVGAGTAIVIAATVQHRRFIATLPQSDRPRNYSGDALTLASSALIALAGVALSAYLTLSVG